MNNISAKILKKFFKLNFEILHFFSRTGYVPKCKAISCPSPLPPLNGKVMDNGHYLVGNTVQYSCNEGFVLIGEPIIRCTESGLWSHAPPFCKYIVINLSKYKQYTQSDQRKKVVSQCIKNIHFYAEVLLSNYVNVKLFQ